MAQPQEEISQSKDLAPKKKILKFAGPELYHVLVPRAEWGALPPKKVIPVALPARHVRYTFTDSANCYTPEECTRAVQELQKAHMDKGCSDIMYNFLVGGDCRVYEGRGWHVEGELPPKYEDLKRETIDLAFVGKFKPLPVPKDMIDVARGLVDWGTDLDLIRMPFTAKEYNFDSSYWDDD